VSAYLPTPDARRAKSEQAFGKRSFEAAALAATAPAPAVLVPAAHAAAVQAPAGHAPAGHAPAVQASAGHAPGVRRTGRRHAAVRPPTVKGNTVVSATAALGAVVTGGLMSHAPTASSVTADAAETNLPPTTLAAAAQPLHVHPASVESVDHLDSASTMLLPVAVPGDRSESIDKQDVEALHKGESLAAEAVAQHAIAAKGAWVLGGHGNLDDWIEVALRKLNLPQTFAGGVKRIIMKESRGNPLAVNRTDSNALAGRPSQGLMQVIPSTFRAYVLPELANRPITDPVANITAGVRYMMANYGLSTLRAGGRTDRLGNYVGY
jgi:Transglycosylase SLT domain